MTNTRKELSKLIQLGAVPVDRIEQALIASRITPDSRAWKHFLSQLLLWLGVISLTSSVMFFIAYNWDDLGRFAKFGLVEVLIALSVFIYWITNRKHASTTQAKQRPVSLVSQAALLMASLFLGVLLAFYGQTYQTGADTWQLFFTWGLLIIPWTLIARFPALWIVWLALLNLSIVLYFQAIRGVFDFMFSSESTTLWVLTIVNAVALIIWEYLENHLDWLSENWAIRVVALASGAPLTFLVIESIFDRHNNILLPSIIWLIAMVAIYIVYRKIKPDLFMLAMACLSGISVIISGAGRVLFEFTNESFGSFILLAILVISLGGLSAFWLKKWHKEFLIKETQTKGQRT